MIRGVNVDLLALSPARRARERASVVPVGNSEWGVPAFFGERVRFFACEKFSAVANFSGERLERRCVELNFCAGSNFDGFGSRAGI